jgi:hypothetical protein
MSVLAASKKANMSSSVDYYHFNEYFKIQNPGIAIPSHIVTHKSYTQE